MPDLIERRCSLRALLCALLMVAAAVGGQRLMEARGGQAPARKGGVTKSSFGRMPGGEPVDLYTLTNAAGVEIRAITLGGIITHLRVPDRSGQFADVVLGFDQLDGYMKDHPYFGAIVGRYGNRIAGGRFTLDGRTYTLATNNGPNHLHGGNKGFDKVLWTAAPATAGAGVVFRRLSPDGEEGYPGNLDVTITYTLNDTNELVVEYHATTDKPTPVNLTQHSYFNLSGQPGTDILDHELTIDADRYTPVDASLIPTGELAPVSGTPFDFRKPAAVGARIDQPHPQLKNGLGYDHNFVLNRKGPGLQRAARVVHQGSGRTLEIHTTEPGVQFYSGNFLDGTLAGKGGQAYKHRAGLCLETQHFPDSPNQPSFPSTILRPGDEYRTRTVFRFGVAR
ncbi:MAG TPA: aldose epimerase family protein [Vicinamibacterales bacterium]|nr:aldose epimerase family protein [Vicinamibacterales bacterium]